MAPNQSIGALLTMIVVSGPLMLPIQAQVIETCVGRPVGQPCAFEPCVAGICFFETCVAQATRTDATPCNTTSDDPSAGFTAQLGVCYGGQCFINDTRTDRPSIGLGHGPRLTAGPSYIVNSAGQALIFASNLSDAHMEFPGWYPGSTLAVGDLLWRTAQLRVLVTQVARDLVSPRGVLQLSVVPCDPNVQDSPHWATLAQAHKLCLSAPDRNASCAILHCPLSAGASQPRVCLASFAASAWRSTDTLGPSIPMVFERREHANARAHLDATTTCEPTSSQSSSDLRLPRVPRPLDALGDNELEARLYRNATALGLPQLYTLHLASRLALRDASLRLTQVPKCGCFAGPGANTTAHDTEACASTLQLVFGTVSPDLALPFTYTGQDTCHLALHISGTRPDGSRHEQPILVASDWSNLSSTVPVPSSSAFASMYAEVLQPPALCLNASAPLHLTTLTLVGPDTNPQREKIICSASAAFGSCKLGGTVRMVQFEDAALRIGQHIVPRVLGQPNITLTSNAHAWGGTSDWFLSEHGIQSCAPMIGPPITMTAHANASTSTSHSLLLLPVTALSDEWRAVNWTMPAPHGPGHIIGLPASLSWQTLEVFHLTSWMATARWPARFEVLAIPFVLVPNTTLGPSWDSMPDSLSNLAVTTLQPGRNYVLLLQGIDRAGASMPLDPMHLKLRTLRGTLSADRGMPEFRAPLQGSATIVAQWQPPSCAFPLLERTVLLPVADDPVDVAVSTLPSLLTAPADADLFVLVGAADVASRLQLRMSTPIPGLELDPAEASLDVHARAMGFTLVNGSLTIAQNTQVMGNHSLRLTLADDVEAILDVTIVRATELQCGLVWLDDRRPVGTRYLTSVARTNWQPLCLECTMIDSRSHTHVVTAGLNASTTNLVPWKTAADDRLCFTLQNSSNDAVHLAVSLLALHEGVTLPLIDSTSVVQGVVALSSNGPAVVRGLPNATVALPAVLVLENGARLPATPATLARFNLTLAVPVNDQGLTVMRAAPPVFSTLHVRGTSCNSTVSVMGPSINASLSLAVEVDGESGDLHWTDDGQLGLHTWWSANQSVIRPSGLAVAVQVVGQSDFVQQVRGFDGCLTSLNVQFGTPAVVTLFVICHEPSLWNEDSFLLAQINNGNLAEAFDTTLLSLDVWWSNGSFTTKVSTPRPMPAASRACGNAAHSNWTKAYEARQIPKKSSSWAALDVTGDGGFDIRDAAQVLRLALEGTSATTAYLRNMGPDACLRCLDSTADGRVTIEDARLLLQVLAGRAFVPTLLTQSCPGAVGVNKTTSNSSASTGLANSTGENINEGATEISQAKAVSATRLSLAGWQAPLAHPFFWVVRLSNGSFDLWASQTELVDASPLATRMSAASVEEVAIIWPADDRGQLLALQSGAGTVNMYEPHLSVPLQASTNSTPSVASVAAPLIENLDPCVPEGLPMAMSDDGAVPQMESYATSFGFGALSIWLQWTEAPVLEIHLSASTKWKSQTLAGQTLVLACANASSCDLCWRFGDAVGNSLETCRVIVANWTFADPTGQFWHHVFFGVWGDELWWAVDGQLLWRSRRILLALQQLPTPFTEHNVSVSGLTPPRTQAVAAGLPQNRTQMPELLAAACMCSRPTINMLNLTLRLPSGTARACDHERQSFVQQLVVIVASILLLPDRDVVLNNLSCTASEVDAALLVRTAPNHNITGLDVHCSQLFAFELFIDEWQIACLCPIGTCPQSADCHASRHGSFECTQPVTTKMVSTAAGSFADNAEQRRESSAWPAVLIALLLGLLSVMFTALITYVAGIS
ncbi:uncharacterized protein MONBRDRAFT_6820 [Monosiga brevicollis MX1]|uniref:Uncharacterized protein n=1 Tax=Monosiga brevicollis TaxID=81824 RepID=A9UUC3_MONBE|nr:uncharacterized protein MONBRDRAFT_6820 [Monosiga brevicollis MX1]EDQ91070.1 predicted protein [Monosiga brevicollis MX1]|eukprot:XP_001744367.1 hypothetical protein [Monosiga brevicollis MX1]